MKLAFDFLCIDEHDSPNLAELSNKSRREISLLPNHRYFGICGVIIPGATYSELNMEGHRIQRKINPLQKYAPFHYSEILNKKGKFAYLGVDASKYTSLTTLLNQLIKNTKFRILACYIDKQKLALEYGIFVSNKLTQVRRIKPNMHKPAGPREINLYEISLKYILIEYYGYLSESKKRGLIIAEARGEQEDKKLLDAFYDYQRTGVGSLSGKELRQYVVDLLIIRKSQNHLGLQIADLITYPFYEYFVSDHNIRKDHFITKGIIESKKTILKIFP